MADVEESINIVNLEAQEGSENVQSKVDNVKKVCFLK